MLQYTPGTFILTFFADDILQMAWPKPRISNIWLLKS